MSTILSELIFYVNNTQENNIKLLRDQGCHASLSNNLKCRHTNRTPGQHTFKIVFSPFPQ
jgi:hypothetical protein